MGRGGEIIEAFKVLSWVSFTRNRLPWWQEIECVRAPTGGYYEVVIAIISSEPAD